jgi:parvulin-like peptidyl-prolyl isomerase
MEGSGFPLHFFACRQPAREYRVDDILQQVWHKSMNIQILLSDYVEDKMKYSVRNITFLAMLGLLLSLLGACSDGPSDTGSTPKAEQGPGELQDTVARVGDQPITFSQINTMLNSSAVVGLSIPALGTPERDKVRILLLDRIVSAYLIYLDALKLGVDKDPGYQQELKRFSDSLLAGAYRRQYMVGDISVSDEEIKNFHETNVMPGTEMSEEVRAQIESSLRNHKLQQRLEEARKTLREGVEVIVYEQNFSSSGDAERADSAVVARVDGVGITWGEVKQKLIAADKGVMMVDILAMDDDARLPALQGEIDLQIMTRKARESGLGQDPVYLTRFEEFRKTRLINTHRAALTEKMMPSDEELEAYYEANIDTIAIPEFRKVQEVVVPTKEAALEVKEKVEAGEITMYQAARDYSIAPGARQNLGEIGWVTDGKALPAMDEVIFALEPGEYGGPVETPVGWHVVTVLDVKDAEYTYFDDRTRTVTLRKYIHEKLDEYVVNLRQNEFEVEVYEDNLIRLAQAEADMVKQLTEKAKEPGSVTEKRIEEFQEFIGSKPVALPGQ